MNLVADANILFSALIKDSLSTKLLFNQNLKLYCPDFMIEEILKHYRLIREKSSLDEEKFIQVMHMLKDQILVIQQEKYSDFIEEAIRTSPDINDAMYFALALKLSCKIWSNDKKLKNQDKVKVLNTEEIVKLFGI
jgi:predicted nucleic acid-binding protein